MKKLNSFDYKRFRWFFTSNSLLVVGGKSAEQNDLLLKSLKKELDFDCIVMHTRGPGSPFTVILDDLSKIKISDIEECAVFTGCFSKAWKQQKKSTLIDIFSLSQINKTKSMKVGTWKVIGKIKTLEVELKLVLTRQKGILRAVPEKTVEKKGKIFLKIKPGKIDKSKMVEIIKKKIPENVSTEEILSAFPPGGIEIIQDE